ncbi:MAG: 4Fe-4S dicluster domain-containing protein [Cellulosilyticaceae bacterium]
MELLEQVREAGLVGAGGAGFPTHVKLKAQAEYILLNGAECEPLLRVDQQLMALYPDEIIKGFEAAGRLVAAKKAIMGVKGKHKEVIKILRQRIDALKLQDFVEVKELEDVYPAGDEQVLVYELTGRVVPETGIPLNVGCVVINSETALNVYKASCGESITETYITVAGDVPRALTSKVPVGTPIIDVLRMSGIENFDNYTVIDGGPMMGPLLEDINGVVTKKDKGYIILRKDHGLIQKKGATIDQAKRVNKASCEQCRMCTDLCPRYLLGHNLQPHKVIRGLNYVMPEVAKGGNPQLCCQCNLCQLFSCPAGIYPKSANIIANQKLASEGYRYKPHETKFEARGSREYRLVPSKRLIARLGLSSYDKAAPMTDIVYEPSVVRIATKQHVGAPAIPIVKVGDQVKCGQLIGTIPENSLGATIHASISGTVTEVSSDFVVIRRE